MKQKKFLEFEGANVEEAIKKGLIQLGLAREKVVVKIISEEKKGLFGMEGSRPARIKIYF